MYLIKFSASIAVVYLFYKFVLRRLTFYNANRLYLIGYCLLSFFIPFINIEPIVHIKTFNEMQVINFIPVIENNIVINKNYLQKNANSFTINYWDILLIILAFGSLIMIARLLIQFLSLQKIKRNATIINDGKTNIYHVDKNIIPFSFGNSIYVNQHLHSEKEMEDIILHEYVHVKQKHTLDILLAEFICIINWYNPFAWFIRHSIRQNLEFIADNDVLKKGIDKKNYQYHLLKIIGVPQYRIANSFNFSSLKKRITMMNKLKSAKLNLVKFLFILPLIAVLLIAFRDKYAGVFENISNKKSQLSSSSLIDSISNFSTINNKNTKENFSDKSEKVLPVVRSDAKETAYNKTDTIPGNKNALNFSIKPMPENPIYIVDGIQMPEGWTPQNSLLKPGDITNVSFVKNDSALILSKGKARNTIIYLTTKNKEKLLLKTDTVPGNKNTIIKLYSNNSSQPLFIINDNISDSSAISKLNPQDIKSINILKDFSAISAYGEKGRNGVVLIKTKSIERKTDAVPPNTFDPPVSKFFMPKAQPLFIVNDKELTDGKGVEGVDANSIESVVVIKDSNATKIYGDRGRNGVIIIKTKKAEQVKPPETKKESSFQNKKNNEYPIIGKAEKIILDKKGVEIIGGSLSMNDDKTSFAKGSILINNTTDHLPLIVYNNKKIDRLKNFQTVAGNYKLISLNQKETFQKYGDNRIEGAIEI